MIAPELRGYDHTEKPASGQGGPTTSWTRGRGRRGTSVVCPHYGHLCQEGRPDVVDAELLDLLSDRNG